MRVVHQSDKPTVFGELFGPGEDREHRVLAFQAHMTSFLRRDGLPDAVETDEHKIEALAEADQAALMKNLGKRK